MRSFTAGSSNDRGFTINGESGAISVSRNLDRETQNRVILTVMAKNAGGIRGNDTDEAQVIVTVQDGNDPPEFLQLVYRAEVSEAAPIGEYQIFLHLAFNFLQRKLVCFIYKSDKNTPVIFGNLLNFFCTYYSEN